MTKEEKDLLLRDLCARLPYGVKVQYLTEGDKTYICNVDQVSIKSQCVGIAETGHTVFTWRTIDRIKPYLRPLSSMTEEQKQIVRWFKNDIKTQGAIDLYMNRYIEWLNSRHFDWRTDGNGKTLIEKGLAIEAPKEMYNI